VLVVDANVVVRQCADPVGFAPFRREELVAPPFMWAEARSTLHEALWRGAISRPTAAMSLDALESAPVAARIHRRLGREAWRIADELGWAKTYDAEYVALAQLLGCRLVTVDERLRRRTESLGFVIGPTEL
jgi:predicted nucleic acid-binding protein